MSSQRSEQNAANSAELSEVAEGIAAIPDKLVAVQLYLRPLCSEDSSVVPADVKQTIDDACAVLHSAIADLMEILRNLPGADGKDQDAGPTTA